MIRCGCVVLFRRRDDSGEGTRIEFTNIFNWEGKFEDELTKRGLDVLFPETYELPREEYKFIYVGGFGEGGKRALELVLSERVCGCFALDLQEEIDDVLIQKLKNVNKPIALTNGGRTVEQLKTVLPSVIHLKCLENEEAPSSSAIEATGQWLLEQIIPYLEETSSPTRTESTLPQAHIPTQKSYTLHSLAEQDTYEAIFQVPAGAEDLFYKYPVTCRGALFNLQKCGSGLIKTTFRSSLPEATADAIALRVRARFDDPAGLPSNQNQCPVS
mmetsp:Transcript_9584/g.12022  ORF Transcript_9584/g.12022 Transcript_9584/m.12022 type:complete len:272 (-) Transcript_9584:1292-2107(-)